MVGRRILYWLVLVGCFCFCIAYQQWLAWFLLAALLVFPTFSLLVSLEAMLSVRLRLSIPKTVPLGDPTEVAVLHRCAMPAPLWRYKVLVERPLTGQRWKLRPNDLLPTEHCGTLVVTIKKARIYDYLGLTGWPVRIRPSSGQVIVRPDPVPVEDLPSLQRLMTHQWKPKPGGGFAENHELRLYRPGDSIQQIHWKLSAKTGSLILREPMEPMRNRLLLRMDLNGTPHELDTKLGQLLWISQQFLSKDLHFQIQCLTGKGIRLWQVTSTDTLDAVMDELLAQPLSTGGSLQPRTEIAGWQYFIGGGSHEQR